MNVEQIAALGLVVAGLAVYMQNRRPERIRQHNSLRSGIILTRELMETENNARFLAANRMDRSTFVKLVRLLSSDRGGLKVQKTICRNEKVMIYLQVLKGMSIREICEMFQHSSSTISYIVHDVSNSFMRCESQLFPRLTVNTLLSDKIALNPKFFPFFDNCDGALDGTHIPAVIKSEFQGVFRNRKKFISQNVLGVSNFDLIFIYALAGWEGSAHDGKVLADAKLKGLPMRPGKFYLGDAGYALSDTCLTPYRGTRYHLKEWVRGGRRPQRQEKW